MRLDKNRWQEGAGLFIKKANANPYSVVAAYLGEMEKIADPLRRLAMIEEAIAQRMRSGLKPTEEMVQQARSLRGALQESAEAAARRPHSAVGPGSPLLPGAESATRGKVRAVSRTHRRAQPVRTTPVRREGSGEALSAAEAERFGTPRSANVAAGEGEFSDRAALYGKDNFNRPGDVSDEALAAFEGELGAIDRARPVAVANMDRATPGFRSQQEILGGSPEAGPRRAYRGAQGLDPAARGPGKRNKNTVIPLDEATAADDLRGAQRLDMGGPRAEPDVSAFAADEAGRAPRGAWSKVGLEPEEIPEVSRGRSVRLASNRPARPAPGEVDRPTTMGARFDEVDRPTSVALGGQDFLGQADALTQASAEAARRGDMEGSRRLAVQASSFEREFDSLKTRRWTSSASSAEQVRGEPTAAMARDRATAVQPGRGQVTDATVVERPLSEATVAGPAIPNLPDSAIEPRHLVNSRPAARLKVSGGGQAAQVQALSREVIPESAALSDDPVMRAWQQGQINETARDGMLARRAAPALKSEADVLGPSAPPKPTYTPPPQEQNVLRGAHNDPKAVMPASEAVQHGHLKPTDEHTGFQPPGITKDPPAQMSQPVDAPNPPADIQQGANSPMAPTPEAPVAVAPVWKRRAALAGAGTLAAGGAFGVGYGGRQVLQQPQQGQR